MKFGQELQSNIFPPWRLSYFSYDVLKVELKTRQLDHGWTEDDENDFIELLDSELKKVYDFVNAKLTEIDARILYCERTVQTLQNRTTMRTEDNYLVIDEALTEVLFDVHDLHKFTRLNFTAIQKILKKHDKWTSTNLRQEYNIKLQDRPLDTQRFDSAIVYISGLHNICRNRGQPTKGNSAAGGDQNEFERATAKYWVHPDNITEVKAIIMLHLPVLIFDNKKKWEPEDSAVSSVYYDNQSFDLYTERLQRDEGAEAIRFRWYGPFDTKHVFIERKTHHAEWRDGASVKDRFRIDEKDVNRFVSGELSADMIAAELRTKNMDEKAIKDVHFIANGVQKSFRERRVEPMIRVFYNRTAFQRDDSQMLRISLDTNLTFIREDEHRRLNNNWRRTDVGIDYPFNYLDESELLRFPYAVLETKLQTHLGQEPPEWLTNLIESHLVHEVPRFSKYLHGASYFFRDQLPLLPWWLSELGNDIKRGRMANMGLSRSLSFKPLIDGKYRRAALEERQQNHVAQERGLENTNYSQNSSKTLGAPQSNSTSPLNRRRSVEFDEKRRQQMRPIANDDGILLADLNGPSESSNTNDKKKPNVKVRVEPKTFFANERTFITWLQFCALLLTVALNLLNFGDYMARIVGGVFMGIAAVVAIYALYMFERRAYMINHQIAGRFDDLYGPAVLCVLVVIALIINLWLRFRPTDSSTASASTAASSST